MTIQPLRAAHGDSIIIKGSDINPFTIIIDGGPEDSWDDVLPELNKYAHIDLLVLTHYDKDHIEGLLEFINQNKENTAISIDNIWINAPHLIAADFENKTANYSEADTLLHYIEEMRERGIVKNCCYCLHNGPTEKPFIVTDKFDITILSPEKDTLYKLKDDVEEYLESVNDDEHDDEDLKVSYSTVLNDSKMSLDELCILPVGHDSSLSNKTSISFLLFAEGKTVMMLGDAHAEVIDRKLKELKHSIANKLDVDLMKVSHHGSKYNVSKQMLEMIKCNKYLFSTNGGCNTYHPDKRTIAYIWKYGSSDEEKIELFFNYPLQVIQERFPLLDKHEQSLFTIIDNALSIEL